MQKDENNMRSGISENLKKGLTELLILSFLEKEAMPISTIINRLDEKSDGACKISYPYAAIYRLMRNNYIEEIGKKIDENRLRQFYNLTQEGEIHLKAMREEYDSFMRGVNKILKDIDGQ